MRSREPLEFRFVTPDELVLDVRVREETNRWGERNLRRNGRIHFWHESDTVLSDLTRRMNRVARPYTFYRRQVLPTLIREMRLGDDAKFRWSEKAGCWCPCSPGFICDSYRLRGLNIYVTIKSL